MTVESAGPRPIAFKAYVAAILLRVITRLLCSTYRIQFVEGEERFTDLPRDRQPIILCAWHNRIFFLSYLVEKFLTRKGFKLTQMASMSKDGDIGYLLGIWAKVHVVRGSSNRGGTKGLRALFREIQKNKSSIVLLPDGSQGPVYQAKAGTVVLAQLSGVPVHLFSYEADRAWRVKSWDRLIVPKPFARITIRFSEGIQVPRQLAKGELEEQRVKLEQALNALKVED